MAANETRVLICEDDEALVELLQTRFELAGYRTFVARSGGVVVDSAINNKPHAIVLDIGLPVIDGFKVLERLKADARVKNIPVMMLTARHARDDVQKTIQMGAKDYLTKPFDDKILLARVARLISLAAAKAGPAKDEGTVTYL
jgi:DNA-binding response OmpR family regulator